MLSGQAELPKTAHLPAGRQENFSLLPTSFSLPSHFLLTFFPLILRVKSNLKSPYMPFSLISCNSDTIYIRDSNETKRKSMIVRFV
jgi:hypothetical protein